MAAFGVNRGIRHYGEISREIDEAGSRRGPVLSPE